MRSLLILMVAATAISMGCTKKMDEVPSVVDPPSPPADPARKDNLSQMPAVMQPFSAERANGGNSKNNRIGNATDWREIDISGKKLELIHDSVRQTLVFNPEGDVKAVFGIRGGAETAPILAWTLKADVLILSSEAGSPVIMEFREPYIQGSPESVFGQTLSVMDGNGRESLYKISRAEE